MYETHCNMMEFLILDFESHSTLYAGFGKQQIWIIITLNLCTTSFFPLTDLLANSFWL